MNIKIYDSRDFPSYLPKLNQLYDDLFLGGKGFRAQLVNQVGSYLGLSDQTRALLAQTIEFIHNASLLHDDVIDRSVLRRGKPAAWTRYGAEYTILAGDYLLARVMVNLSQFGNIDLVHYTALMISDLLEGEWLQDSLVGDDKVQPIDLDRVHNLKTASLFKWCLHAPLLISPHARPALLELMDEMGTLLGQLFQRSDDLLDFDIRNHEKKAVLGDLKSGYINSFAAFCLSHKSVNTKTAPNLIQLKSCQSVADFAELLGGVAIFKQRQQEFDEQNQEKIDLYLHYVEQCEWPLIGLAEGKGLGEFLKSLPTLLYWRQRP